MQATQDIEAVRKVVASTEAFPEAAKQVFLDGLPGSITGTSGMLLAAALEDAKVAATIALKDTGVSVEEAQRDLAASAEALAAAEAAAEAASTELHSCTEANAAAAKLLKDSEKNHKAAETKNAHQVKEWAELREQHARVTSIVEGSLRMLVSGGWEDAEVMEASLEAVKGHLESSHADKVLIAGSGSALGTKPESRHPFDVIVVDEVNKSLNDHLASLQGKVEAVAPLEKSTRSESLGLWAIADCAREDAAQASAAEAAAKRGQKRTHDDLAKAKKAAHRLENKLADLTKTKAAKEQELADIEAALAAAKRLKAAPPAEAVAPAADDMDQS